MSSDKKLTLAQNASLNSIGIVFYCACQWLMTLLVAREDYSNAGILQLSISISNIFYTISTYNLRTFQVSDLKNDYSSGDYVGSRIITSLLSLVFCIIYAISTGNDFNTILCISCYMIFRLSEAIADVLHGIDQKNYRMDYVAVSYILRGAFSLLAFLAVLYTTHNILLAIVAMAAGGFSVVLLYDLHFTSKLSDIKPRFHAQKLLSLFSVCLPSVIASATFVAISTVPRQYLEAMYSKTILGYYATVATPIVIVQVLATSIFNPIITELAVFFNGGEIKKFRTLFRKTLFIIVGFAIAAYIGAALLGKFAMTLLYGKSIAPYVYLMYAIIACTVLYAACWLTANILIIMRKLKIHMIISISSLLLAVICGRFFISKFYMNGVSFCIILSYIIYFICELIILEKELAQRSNKNELQL